MKKLIIALVVVVAVIGVIIGWGSINDANAPGGATTTQGQDAASTTDVKSLISYALPASWQEQSCADADQYIYVVPSGAAFDCKADPRAPVSLMVDPRNTSDCQQVTAPNGVLRHTCKSLFIDGRKTILSETEYPKSEMYPKPQTVSDYFVDTGKGIVQIEYVYGAKGSNTYQAGFDTLVQSVKIR